MCKAWEWKPALPLLETKRYPVGLEPTLPAWAGGWCEDNGWAVFWWAVFWWAVARMGETLRAELKGCGEQIKDSKQARVICWLPVGKEEMQELYCCGKSDGKWQVASVSGMGHIGALFTLFTQNLSSWWLLAHEHRWERNISDNV